MQEIDNIHYETENRREWCSSKGKPSPCFLFARKFTRPAALHLLNLVSFNFTKYLQYTWMLKKPSVSRCRRLPLGIAYTYMVYIFLLDSQFWELAVEQKLNLNHALMQGVIFYSKSNVG